MSRYIRDVKLDQPIDVVSMIMEDYVYHSRFRRNDWNGEMVYYLKDKHGRERYLEWRYVDGVFHVEAWLKSRFGNELGLDSFGGGASKREFKVSLEQLIRALKRQAPNTISSGHVGSDPLHHTNNYAAEHRIQRQGQQMSFGTMPSGNGQSKTYQTGNINNGTSGKKSGVLPLVIMSLLCASVPVLGVIFGLAAIISDMKTGQNSLKGLLKVLCILAIVASLLSFLVNFSG